MNNIDKRYQDLLQDILDNGIEKKDRTGTGTISVFGRQIRHKMSEGFPLLTTKKMAWKTMVTELLWFLRGDTNIRFLLLNDCHIWSGDAYKNYRENKSILKQYDGGGDVADIKQFEQMICENQDFADEWGELGPIYGAQWREWYTKKFIKTTIKDPLSGNDTYMEGDEWIDQIENLIKDLKSNPDSRRLMVSAWNVGQLDQMILPPCHYGFQVYTRELSFKERCDIQIEKLDGIYSNEKDMFIHHLVNELKLKKMNENNIPTRAISLMWNQRSVDTFLGLPFNIASYGLLLEIIAKEVNMVPDELIGNLGDVHLYTNHIEQAKEQISREPMNLPKVKILDAQVDDIAHYELMDIDLIGYQSHPAIKAPLSN